MSRQTRFLTPGLLGALLLATTACGSDSKSVSAGSVAASSDTAAAATTVAATPAGTAPAGTAPAPAPTEAGAVPTAIPAVTNPPAHAGGKVNINEASTSELEAAFKAVGVSNARRWAQEVDEYRPYPTDPGFAKLRQELGKYNIDPKVLELILSTLEF